MDEQQAWRVIAAQRLAIADLLDGLTPEQWAAPSLCAGWTITDVAGHLAAVLRPASAGAMASAAIRARGRLHGMIDLLSREAAAEYGTRSAAMLRDEADSSALPRLTNWRNIVFDTQIHAQDIARPLGLRLPVDTAAAAQGAERIWRVGYLFGARKRFAGLRFVATDVGWSAGDGPVVRGPIADLLLVLSGRPAGLAGLDGAGARAAAERLGVAG
ncbi:maleylpyruvate isomerase family mycothiol-dependent enzyme [Tsukamurella paurometabola]|uniref:Maleylpyruvate isomerase family mycothiol-dependent enzyme n=1 Tax=Tsukamurella paurometabola TaxID=2061 RepID=A0ABS5N997_TSUPA|nr:maleylpyruvate isomerase family mycothiol-dependent enzyme [Tsukamurella paurometabola]MBS4100222.1 maleylpyruvate isomerase family mycothiol-dependent enzyme [Tsukamurella paurometabola]